MPFRSTPERRRTLSADVAAVAALEDATRHGLYEYVSASPTDVSREEAATALGLTRRVAAFNLDRLVEEGLLEVSFRRLTGRTGPGAGRPSKLYRRSGVRVDVSLPPRNYELLARLLAAGAEPRKGVPEAERFHDAARTAGTSVGLMARKDVAVPAKSPGPADPLISELSEQGFQPFTDGEGTIRLRNCPYHEMARENTEFVCSLNLAFMQGVATGLGRSDLRPVLDPREGACCVAFRQVSVSS